MNVMIHDDDLTYYVRCSNEPAVCSLLFYSLQ